MIVKVAPFILADADAILAGQKVRQWTKHGPELEKAESFTLKIDEKPCLATGIIELWPGVGEAWMLSSILMQQHPLVAARAVKRNLSNYIKEKGYWRVQANVRVGWPQAEKFAAFVGMKREGLMPKFGPEKEDHYRYAWVK